MYVCICMYVCIYTYIFIYMYTQCLPKRSEIAWCAAGGARASPHSRPSWFSEPPKLSHFLTMLSYSVYVYYSYLRYNLLIQLYTYDAIYLFGISLCSGVLVTAIYLRTSFGFAVCLTIRCKFSGLVYILI